MLGIRNKNGYSLLLENVCIYSEVYKSENKKFKI